MQLPSIRFLTNAVVKAATRFPESLISATFSVVALWILMEKEGNDTMARLSLTGIIGISLTISLKVLTESHSLSKNTGWMLRITGIIALAALWYWFPDLHAPDIEYRGMPQYAAALIMTHLLCSVVPFIGRGSVRDFWVYNRTLLTNIVLGAIYSAVLFVSLFLALVSLNELFDLHLNPRIYARLFVFIVGIFNTVFFLFNFPENHSSSDSDTGYHTVLVNLCKYVLVPVVGLYFLILYAYSVKILVNQELPRGWVSSLILGFSVAGIFTYLLNFYIRDDSRTALTNLFHKWFWPVLLPMTLLLFAAISRRISDYGVTEARFLVAHLGVWLFISSLYFIISGKDDIRFIPGSLLVFGLLWIPGSGILSDYHQKTRLLDALQSSGRIKDGIVRPDSTAIDSTTLGQIRSAIGYFDDRGNLGIMNPVLPIPADSITRGAGAGRFLEWLGAREPEPFLSDYINVYIGDGSPSLDLSGYNRLSIVSIEEPGTMCTDTANQHKCFSISADRNYFIWHQLEDGEHVTIDSFEIAPLLVHWKNLSSRSDETDFRIGNSRVELTGTRNRIAVITGNAALFRSDSLSLDNGQFYILYNDR